MFALPSHYEVFPLVVLEAAAAGLPLLVTPLNGVEEFFRDGENGFLVEKQDALSLSDGLRRLLKLLPNERVAMGRAAQSSVRQYDPTSFASAWTLVYQNR